MATGSYHTRALTGQPTLARRGCLLENGLFASPKAECAAVDSATFSVAVSRLSSTQGWAATGRGDAPEALRGGRWEPSGRQRLPWGARLYRPVATLVGCRGTASGISARSV